MWAVLPGNMTIKALCYVMSAPSRFGTLLHSTQDGLLSLYVHTYVCMYVCTLGLEKTLHRSDVLLNVIVVTAIATGRIHD